jgi:transcriptional/translational regulatory protein YebC/TACO1
MAGHKNWSKIKRAKGALKINMGELFSRLSKEISIAVKLSGGNSPTNPGLLVEINTA